MDIIETIQQYRKDRGWGYVHIADKAGFSDDYISQVLRGKRPKTPVSVVVRIAEAMGLKLTVSL